jgi:hypothetical protein
MRYSTVVCLTHEINLRPQKPQNTHATIEVRVFIARCWVTHAAIERIAAPRLACYYATQR